jgi:plasmid stabilization system protein ParE
VKYRLTSAAEEEFAEASLFLLEESPKAALSFVNEVTEAIKEIAEFPYRYAIFEDDVRSKNPSSPLLDLLPYPYRSCFNSLH